MAEDIQEPGKTMLQRTGLFLGIGLFLIVILFVDLEPGNPVLTRMAAVTVLMAAWWVLDAVPLYATSLMPMVPYPLLGIAYSASAGGMATLVGTPPNLALVQIIEITFPQTPPIAFGTWIFMALPLRLVLLAIIWLFLTKILFRVPAHITIDKSVVDQEYKSLGDHEF